MNEKLKKLTTLGAGDFEHVDGKLIDHLMGTRKLLQSWGASGALRDAGLYHAAYGTAGFSDNLVTVTLRGEITAIIGKEAEGIVYLYCACDRDDFWPQFGGSRKPKFKNRFTGQMFNLDNQALCNFCELTAANELEIAIDNPTFIQKHGQELNSLFTSMQPYLSRRAAMAVNTVLGIRHE